MSQIDIEKLTERRTSEEFPNIVITNPNDTVPVVIRTMEKGDMQLIVEFNGKRKVVARINPSAINVDRMLRTVNGLQYNVSPNISIPINNIVDYLSCIV